MKYAYINNKNKILGWYSDDIHSTIPEPNIKFDDTQWNKAILEGHNYIQDGITCFIDDRNDEEKNIEDVKNNVYKYKKYLAETDYKVLPDYDQKDNLDEILIKRKEAREYIRNNS